MGYPALRFGLVGCGAVSRKHITALNALEGAELAAVCDVDAKAAEVAASLAGVAAYTDVQTMCGHEDVDILSVLTPSGDHADTVCALAAFGKPIIVEKPLAIRSADADRMIAACADASVPLFVVKQNRFNPPVVALRKAIETGRMGKMVMGSVRVWWSRSQAYYDAAAWRGTIEYDGGVLANQAAHHIDMLIWMMGDAQSVTATTASRLANIEAEDTAVAAITFKNGAIGVIEATTAVRPKDVEGSIAIFGEGGNIEIGGYFMNDLKRWDFSAPQAGDETVFEKFGRVPDEPAWNLRQYLVDVIDCVQTGRAGLVDGQEARKTTDLIEAIWEASRLGREVYL